MPSFDIALFFVSQYKRIWNEFFLCFKSNEISRTNSLLCSVCFNSIFNPFILQIEIIIQATWKITRSLYKNNFIFNTLLTINLNSVFRNPNISFETMKRLRNFESKTSNRSMLTSPHQRTTIVTKLSDLQEQPCNQ